MSDLRKYVRIEDLPVYWESQVHHSPRRVGGKARRQVSGGKARIRLRKYVPIQDFLDLNELVNNLPDDDPPTDPPTD